MGSSAYLTPQMYGRHLRARYAGKTPTRGRDTLLGIRQHRLPLPQSRLSCRAGPIIRVPAATSPPPRGLYPPCRQLVGEQSNAYRILLRYDRKSRHRRIKKQRRYERLAATSQLSLVVVSGAVNRMVGEAPSPVVTFLAPLASNSEGLKDR